MSFGTAACNCGVPSTCAALCNTFGNMCQILDAVLERLQSSNKIHHGCYISKCQVNINAAVGRWGRKVSGFRSADRHGTLSLMTWSKSGLYV